MNALFFEIYKTHVNTVFDFYIIYKMFGIYYLLFIIFIIFSIVMLEFFSLSGECIKE